MFRHFSLLGKTELSDQVEALQVINLTGKLILIFAILLAVVGKLFYPVLLFDAFVIAAFALVFYFMKSMSAIVVLTVLGLYMLGITFTDQVAGELPTLHYVAVAIVLFTLSSRGMHAAFQYRRFIKAQQAAVSAK